MLKRILLASFVSCFAFASIGCGDLGDKQLNELSSEERTEVCEDLQEFTVTAEQQTRATCVAVGEQTAEFDESVTCEEARDMCLEDPPDSGVSITVDDCSDQDDTTTDCEATVDEYKACIEPFLQAQRDAVINAQCGAEVDMGDVGGESQACADLQAKCPNFLTASAS